MPDEEFPVVRNDLIMRPVTVRITDARSGWSELLRLDRTSYTLGEHVQLADRIDALRDPKRTPPFSRQYIRELQAVTTEMLARSDPNWTPEMIGRLTTDVCWQIVNFTSPPTLSPSSENQTSPDGANASPSVSEPVVSDDEKPGRKKSAASSGTTPAMAR